MKNVNRIWALVVMAVFSLLLSACNISVERNDDGSLTATTNITAEELEQASEELEDVIGSVLSNNEAQLENVDSSAQDVVMGQKQVETGVSNNQDNPQNRTLGSEAAPPPPRGDGAAPGGGAPPGWGAPASFNGE